MYKSVKDLKSKEMETVYPKDSQHHMSADFDLTPFRGREVIEINIGVKGLNEGIKNRHGVESQ